MRCPRCATELASTAGACPRCGRPLIDVAPTVAAPAAAEPQGPPAVSLPGAPAGAAAPARPEEPPRTYLDRPPLTGRAERYEMIDEAAAEVLAPPTRPAVVGTWRDEAPRPAPAGKVPPRLLLAAGAGVVAIAAVVVAAAIWIGRRPPEPLPPATPVELEPVAASQPDRVLWDGAPLVVTIETKPATAAIKFDGRPVRGHRVDVRRDGQTHTVVVSAPGYVTQAQAFVPRQTGRLRVELRRR